MNKTILIDCAIKGSGGSSTYYRNLINNLAILEEKQQGIKLVYLVNKGLIHLFSEKVLSQSILIDEEKLVGYKRYLWLRRNLKSIKKKYNIDLFFVPYQMSVGFNIIPQILMVRNMEPFGFRKYEYGFKEKLRNTILEITSIWALRKAHKIIAVSSFVKDFLVHQKNIETTRLHEIYHGIERDFSDIEEEKMGQIIKKLNINTPFILTSGSFRPYRRFEDVIVAFNKFKEKLPLDNEEKLVIAGRGLEKYTNAIKQLIEESPYQKHIKYLGFIKKEEMVSLYKKCDFYVASTEIEACPNIAIESLICGCPVISAKTVPLQEIYEDNAIFYEQRNIETLAKQMVELFQNKKLKKELSIKAVKRSENFSWEKCALETFNFLEKSVKNKI